MSRPVHLPGGSGGVWYDAHSAWGPVVRRPVGPWTPAVHALLQQLAQRGLDGIPRVCARDDTTEILTFVEGQALDPGVREADDAVLAQAVAWVRRFHDAVRDWNPGPQVWRQSDKPLRPGQIICHNDPGTYNWIVREGRFAGLIDWDQAGPGDPLHDVAFLCWSALSLYGPVSPAHTAQRLRIVARAYGQITPRQILDAVDARMMMSVDRISRGIQRGDPGMLALRERGEPERTRAAVARFRAGRGDLIAALKDLGDVGEEP